MRSSTSPQIFKRGAEKHVERVIDRAFARILDRHDAEIGDAAFDFVKHLVDRRQRQRAHRGAEVLEHGGLGERALRTEECDLERFLLREAGGHDFAEQARDFLIAQRPVIALERLAQHLRLALRTIEIHGLAGCRLGDADQLREARPLVEQGVNARIDGVDALANVRRDRRPAAGDSRGPPAAARPAAVRCAAAGAAAARCGLPSLSSRVFALELAHEADQRLRRRRAAWHCRGWRACRRAPGGP